MSNKRWTWRRALADDIDETVVLRLLNGEPVNGSRFERLEAVRQLRRQGLTDDAIANHLGVHQRQVARDLADLGLTGTSRAEKRRQMQRRRAILPQLVAAGVRHCELATLLGISTTTLHADFRAVGITGTGRDCRPLRSRHELLAEVGHLLEVKDGAA